MIDHHWRGWRWTLSQVQWRHAGVGIALSPPQPDPADVDFACLEMSSWVASTPIYLRKPVSIRQRIKRGAAVPCQEHLGHFVNLLAPPLRQELVKGIVSNDEMLFLLPLAAEVGSGACPPERGAECPAVRERPRTGVTWRGQPSGKMSENRCEVLTEFFARLLHHFVKRYDRIRHEYGPPEGLVKDPLLR